MVPVLGTIWSTIEVGKEVLYRGTQLTRRTATIDALEMWAEDVGDDTYQWANMLPYYEKSVKYTAPNERLRLSNTTTPSEASAFKHADGPLHVRYVNLW